MQTTKQWKSIRVAGFPNCAPEIALAFSYSKKLSTLILFFFEAAWSRNSPKRFTKDKVLHRHAQMDLIKIKKADKEDQKAASNVIMKMIKMTGQHIPLKRSKRNLPAFAQERSGMRQKIRQS
jgi:hypothetical protein